MHVASLNAVSHDSLQGLEVAALSDIFVIKKIKEQRGVGVVVAEKWQKCNRRINPKMMKKRIRVTNNHSMT